MFSFVRNQWTVFQSVCTIFILTNNEWNFLLLHIFASIWCFSVLDVGQFDRYVSGYLIDPTDLQFSSSSSSSDIWFWASLYAYLSSVYFRWDVCCPFLNLVLVFLLLSFKISLYILDHIPYQIFFCKYFLPVCDLFQSLNNTFHRAEFFNFNDVKSSVFFFHGLCFLCCISEVITKPKVT